MPFRFDNSYSRLPATFFENIVPTPVKNPETIRLNEELTVELGGDVETLRSDAGTMILAGNRVAEGSEPIAMAYSGHQFGGFSPQLGDGRAILLGEVIRGDGVRFDIQLKGSGQTPFSRRGDGRSALGPVLREYIVSEAMHALGVPTTRSLAAVATGQPVFREGPIPGGVLTRVARSHVRIGTFQWFAARSQNDDVKTLADYVIDRHYPEAKEGPHPYRSLFDRVVERQASLIAHWMQLGFIHGVMNTDNMSVSGETIDYGPCAFMDVYHPGKTFSSIDQQGRYAFANQSPIGHWNLARFAETLLPLLADTEDEAVEIATASLDKFPQIHREEMRSRFYAKIGIIKDSKLDSDNHDSDWDLVDEVLSIMADGHADFTLVFRNLPVAFEQNDALPVSKWFAEPDVFAGWFDKWRQRLEGVDRSAAIDLMRTHNPIYIPRNHRVEQAIESGYRGDFQPFHQLVDLLKTPFEEQPEFSEYENPPEAHEVVQATFCGT
ncbi:MAG: YdiU family protein [Rhodopirellula sp. JB044]|uniref:protein adenylyltransferase SelO n=1 Tax=Rhodopirellula sp. JB044 TaxID=3342844 RepID=UPI00370AACDA